MSMIATGEASRDQGGSLVVAPRIVSIATGFGSVLWTFVMPMVMIFILRRSREDGKATAVWDMVRICWREMCLMVGGWLIANLGNDRQQSCREDKIVWDANTTCGIWAWLAVQWQYLRMTEVFPQHYHSSSNMFIKISIMTKIAHDEPHFLWFHLLLTFPSLTRYELGWSATAKFCGGLTPATRVALRGISWST